MKNLLLTAALLIAAITTANAQSVTIGKYKVLYNAAAAKSIGFALDVADNSGYLATCKDATAAIHYLQKEQGVKLTANQVLNIFTIAKEEAPQWALDNAGVKRL